MRSAKRVKSFLISTALLIGAVTPILGASPALAANCSGDGCNGKNPVTSGCNANGYLAKRIAFTDMNGIAMWDKVYADVYYSNICGTNWVRVTNNPWGGRAFKSIVSLNANGTPRYTETEDDYTYGSSFSMMVYAPGNTAVDVWAKLYNQAGVGQAKLPYTVLR